MSNGIYLENGERLYLGIDHHPDGLCLIAARNAETRELFVCPVKSIDDFVEELHGNGRSDWADAIELHYVAEAIDAEWEAGQGGLS